MAIYIGHGQVVEAAHAGTAVHEASLAAISPYDHYVGARRLSATVTSSTDYHAAPAPPVSTGNLWDRLAMCESSGNWAANTGNGFYGGLQFTLSSWAAVGGSGLPNLASRDEQIMRAQLLQARQGWGAWPVCSKAIGLR